MSLTKSQILDEIVNGLAAQEPSIDITKKQAEAVIDDFFGIIIDRASEGEETAWPTIGKFVGATQSAREANNLHTGEKIQVPAKTVLKLKVSAKAKRQVNGEE